MNGYKQGNAMQGSDPGVVEAMGRNPNDDAVHAASDGPYSHLMGQSGDGGTMGGENVKGKNGETFHFK